MCKLLFATLMVVSLTSLMDVPCTPPQVKVDGSCHDPECMHSMNRSAGVCGWRYLRDCDSSRVSRPPLVWCWDIGRCTCGYGITDRRCRWFYKSFFDSLSQMSMPERLQTLKYNGFGSDDWL